MRMTRDGTQVSFSHLDQPGLMISDGGDKKRVEEEVRKENTSRAIDSWLLRGVESQRRRGGRG